MIKKALIKIASLLRPALANKIGKVELQPTDRIVNNTDHELAVALLLVLSSPVAVVAYYASRSLIGRLVLLYYVASAVAAVAMNPVLLIYALLSPMTPVVFIIGLIIAKVFKRRLGYRTNTKKVQSLV